MGVGWVRGRSGGGRVKSETYPCDYGRQVMRAYEFRQCRS